MRSGPGRNSARIDGVQVFCHQQHRLALAGSGGCCVAGVMLRGSGGAGTASGSGAGAFFCVMGRACRGPCCCRILPGSPGGRTRARM